MSKKNGLELLQQELEIPAVVQRRAQDAFDQIHREAKLADQGIVMMNCEAGRKEQTMKKRGRRTKRALVMAIAAAVMVLGTMTVAVAAFRGDLTETLKGMFHISQEQEEDLMNREDGLLQIIETEDQESLEGTESEDIAEDVPTVDISEVPKVEVDENGLDLSEGDVTSVTYNGVTVKLTQAMVDKYHIVLSVRAEGLPKDTTETTGFAETRLRFAGEEKFGSMGRGELNAEEGTLEWVYTIRPRNQQDPVPGWFFGKQLEICLTDLEVFIGKEQGSTKLMEGEWILRWTVYGTEEEHVFELNKELDKTGATVTTVTITPISVETRYNFDKQVYKVEGGGSTHKDPPVLRGVILKDGTVYTQLTGRELMRYAAGSETEYIITGQARYVLDPAQIKILLFADYGKPLVDDNNQVLDHVFVVPLHE